MSSDSESDEEYVPGEPEQVSEEGSADEETDLQYEKEVDHKIQKRKSVQNDKGTKKRKIKNDTENIEIVEEKEPDLSQNPENEKKREEDLWAKFLEGTDTKPKSATNEANQNKLLKSQSEAKAKPVVIEVKQNSEGDKTRNDKERRIFEFAGETVVVEDNVIKEKVRAADNPPAVNQLGGPSSRSRASGGLSSLLGQLNKKGKLSTLEKSKLDWNTFKKEEGIEEEIQSHNKGKAGYLDRRDFLERADHRQYEIERDLRMTRRSNR